MSLDAALRYEAKVDIYSHGICFSRLKPNITQRLREFCVSLMSYTSVYKPRRGYVSVPKKVYAASNRERNEYRFHIHQMDEIFEFLANFGIPKDRLEIINHQASSGVPVDYKLAKWIEPFDYQNGIIDYFTAPGHSKVTTLQTGKGKAQPLDALIKVPNGWTRMGDLKVGSEVISRDGSITKVTGVFPQGKKEIYKITFADGRSTECCKEHLWNIYRSAGSWSNAHKARTIDVEEMIRISKLKGTTSSRMYIDLCQSEQNEDKELLIDPWLMGVLIGDGGLCGDSPRLTSTYEHIVNKVSERLPVGVKLSQSSADSKEYYITRDERRDFNILKSLLDNYDLLGKRAWQKHIPEIYLNGSTEQRFELIRGLMDTDGYVSPDSTMNYCTTSYRLAEQVVYLVRSLGGMAYISERSPKYTYKGDKLDGRKAYQVNMRVTKPSQWVTIPHKLERCNDDGQYAKSLKLRIDSIELVREAEAQCISVDHPEHLYVTNDFIVTHNTVCAMVAIARLGVRSAIVVPGKYVHKWKGDVSEGLGLGKGDLLIVRGSDALINLINLAKTGELKAKTIIITSTTLYNFFVEYEKGDRTKYGINPVDLYDVLGVGVRLIDETHENLHLNFKQDLYGHIHKCLYLSATLDVDDKFLDKILNIAYPKSQRYNGVEYDAYIAVTAIGYTVEDVERFKCVGRNKMYSHIIFEESILSSAKRTNAYVDMIHQIIDDKFVATYKDKMKMIIFAASIEMCTVLAAKIAPLYPGLKVTRYVGEDENEVLYENDIVFTTLKSAGTAVDIPDLEVALLTVAVGSRQLNEQAKGRLRAIKRYKDLTPRYYYLMADNIPKHVEYHERKVTNFKGKVKSHKKVQSAFRI